MKRPKGGLGPLCGIPPGGTLPRKRFVSVGAACGRPRADEDIGPYADNFNLGVGAGVPTRPSAPFSVFRRGAQRAPAVYRPVLRFGNLGALYLVEAPDSSIEQSGSDND